MLPPRTVVLWLLLCGLATAWVFTPPDKVKNRGRNGKSASAGADNSQQWGKVPVQLQEGRDYVYSYSAQITTGLDFSSHANPHVDPTSGEGTGEMAQKAAIQLHAEVSLRLLPGKWARLKLEHAEVGSLNRHVSLVGSTFHDWNLFNWKQLSENLTAQLKMPVRFQWEGGVVGQISYHAEDREQWSRNWKRAVINMLQLNLGESDKAVGPDGSKLRLKSYTVSEKSLEGDCPTLYTVSRSQPEPPQPEDRVMNVTKAVEFQHCNWTADVNFGFPHPSELADCNRVCGGDKKTSELRGACEAGCQRLASSISPSTLRRSTVLNHLLRGDTQAYGIQRVELASDYVFPSVMQGGSGGVGAMVRSAVVAELNFQSVVELKPSKESGKTSKKGGNPKFEEEDLSFGISGWLREKRLYMHGELSNSTSRSETGGSDKAKHRLAGVERLLRRIAHSDGSEDLERGMLDFHQLVDALRRFSVGELRQLYAKLIHDSDKRSAVELGLGAAATLNSLTFFSELAASSSSTKIPEWRQALVLKIFDIASHSPSDEQARVLLDLCARLDGGGEGSGQGTWLVRQACWLAAGSLVNKLCIPTTGAVCPPGRQTEYSETLFNSFHKATDFKGRILALKAIGNAGLASGTRRLLRVIESTGNRSAEEEGFIRSSAIDSLRRLPLGERRQVLPSLLSILLNESESPVVRMTAFWQLMSSEPSMGVVDQVIGALGRINNKQVRSFLHSTLRDACERGSLRRHLRSCKTLDSIPSEEVGGLSGCGTTRLGPLNLNLASAFTDSHALPSYIGLGTSPSCLPLSQDRRQRGRLGYGSNLLIGQSGLEHWLEELAGYPDDDEGGTDGQEGTTNRNAGGSDSGESFSKRKAGNGKTLGAFGLFHLRHQDVDQLLSVVEETDLAGLLGGRGGQSAEQRLKLLPPKHYDAFLPMLLADSFAYVPTSIGLPLKLSRSVPAVVSVRGQLGFTQSSKLQAKLGLLAVGLSHQHKMETALSGVDNVGVQLTHSLEASLPSELTIQHHPSSVADGEAPEEHGVRSSHGQGLKLTVKSLQKKAPWHFGVHSVPSTFVAEHTEGSHATRVDLKPLHNSFHPASEVNASLGSGLSLSAHYHWPGGLHPGASADLGQLTDLLLVTENHAHLRYTNKGGGEKVMELAAGGKLFEKVGSRELASLLSRQFPNFYTDWPAMNSSGTGGKQLQQSLNVRVGKINKRNRVYRHWVKLETSAGSPLHSDSINSTLWLKAECEDTLNYCQLGLEARANASDVHRWRAEARGSFILPDQSQGRSADGVGDRGKGWKKLVGRANVSVETSSRRAKQWMGVRLHGDSVKVGKSRGPRRLPSHGDSRGRRVALAERQRQTAFINEFQLKMEWGLSRRAERYLHERYEMAKIGNWWNWVPTAADQPHGLGRGQAETEAVLNPVTRRHLNLTIRSPFEPQPVRFESIELEEQFPLQVSLSSGDTPNEMTNLNSLAELIRTLGMMGRVECTLSGGTVMTFDGVNYTAPLSNCYTELVNACPSTGGNGTAPRFSVFAKADERVEGAMKLKIVTPKETIEAELRLPSGGTPLRGDDDDDYEEESGETDRLREVEAAIPLVVRVNGQRAPYNSDGPLEKAFDGYSSIRFTNNRKSGVEVRLKDLGVVFNGARLRVRLSPRYRNILCGLCAPLDGGEAQRGGRSQGEGGRGPAHGEDEACNGARRQSVQSRNQGGVEGGTRRIAATPVTRVVEYNHKICFSTRPVGQCLLGAGGRPAATGYEVQSHEFVCLIRSGVNARRMLRSISRLGRRGEVKDEEKKAVEEEVDELAQSLQGYAAEWREFH